MGAAFDAATEAEAVAAWLGGRLAAAGAERFVLGLSGGIDSAVVCGLCCRAAGPGRVLAAIMPSHSNPLDAEHAELVAAAFGVDPVRVDLSPVADAFFAAMPGGIDGLETGAAGGGGGSGTGAGAAGGDGGGGAGDPRARLAAANVKPRLRMATLYFLANGNGGIVVGTGNKTEARLGYFTKYGDGGVDLLPIVDFYKHEVRALAAVLGVPEPVIAKAPSAGLWPGQTDEDELGAGYDALDAALIALETGAPCPDEVLCERVRRLEAASAHKRAPAPAFKRRVVG
jgi:NAD+ synthase